MYLSSLGRLDFISGTVLTFAVHKVNISIVSGNDASLIFYLQVYKKNLKSEEAPIERKSKQRAKKVGNTIRVTSNRPATPTKQQIEKPAVVEKQVRCSYIECYAKSCCSWDDNSEFGNICFIFMTIQFTLH